VAVSESDVRQVASLARLGLEESRIPALVRELNGILGHMEVLEGVGTGGGGRGDGRERNRCDFDAVRWWNECTARDTTRVVRSGNARRVLSRASAFDT
jgi:hypothetical protein